MAASMSVIKIEVTDRSKEREIGICNILLSLDVLDQEYSRTTFSIYLPRD